MRFLAPTASERPRPSPVAPNATVPCRRGRGSRIDRDIPSHRHSEVVQRIVESVDQQPWLGETERATEQRDAKGTAIAPCGDIEADSLEDRSHRIERFDLDGTEEDPIRWSRHIG